MVNEHLLRCSIPKDKSSNFSKLLQAIGINARGDILRSMALMLGANRLLAMAKNIASLHLNVVGKMFL